MDLTEPILTTPDLVTQVDRQLGESPIAVGDLTKQVIQDIAVRDVSQDLLVLVAHMIDVIGVSLELIHKFR